MECPNFGCSWFGPELMLPSHYKKWHKRLLYKDFYFPIVKSTEKFAYLVISDGKFFIVKLKQDDILKKQLYITLSVHLVGSAGEAQNYMYHLELRNTLESQQKFSSKCVVSNLDSRLHSTKFHLDVNYPDKTLFYHSKPVTIYKIIITTKQELLVSDKFESIVTRELECPCCFEIMEAPIKLCGNGHNTCHECLPKGKCYICSASITATRSLFAELVAREALNTKSECTYKKDGCLHVSSLNSIGRHEKHCVFGHVPCPLKHLMDCTWKGNVNGMVAHTQDEHRDNFLEGNQVVVPFTEGDDFDDDDDCFVFARGGEIFRLLYKFKKHVFYWAVQLVGPSLEFNEYKYTLSLVSKEEDKFRFSVTYPCLPYTEANAVGSWLKCPSNLAMCFLDEDMNLTYQINVVKEGEVETR